MTISKENNIELIKTHINIISALYKPEKEWLREREKEFLAYSVIAKKDGFDLKSKESVAELKTKMNFSSKDDVYNYRRNLKKKGWLVQTTDGIILPTSFDRFIKGKNSVKYNFKVECPD